MLFILQLWYVIAFLHSVNLYTGNCSKTANVKGVPRFLAGNCSFQVFNRISNSAHGAQVGVGMDCFGCGCGPKEFGRLWIALPVCLFGKGQILSVCL